MSIENLYNLTMDTLMPLRTSDGQGGWTETLVPADTGQPCACQVASQRERDRAARLEGEVTHVVYCPVTVRVQHGYQVQVSNGVTGRVMEAWDDSGRGHHLKVMVDARQHG